MFCVILLRAPFPFRPDKETRRFQSHIMPADLSQRAIRLVLFKLQYESWMVVGEETCSRDGNKTLLPWLLLLPPEYWCCYLLPRTHLDDKTGVAIISGCFCSGAVKFGKMDFRLDKNLTYKRTNKFFFTWRTQGQTPRQKSFHLPSKGHTPIFIEGTLNSPDTTLIEALCLNEILLVKPLSEGLAYFHNTL